MSRSKSKGRKSKAASKTVVGHIQTSKTVVGLPVRSSADKTKKKSTRSATSNNNGNDKKKKKSSNAKKKKSSSSSKKSRNKRGSNDDIFHNHSSLQSPSFCPTAFFKSPSSSSEQISKNTLQSLEHKYNNLKKVHGLSHQQAMKLLKQKSNRNKSTKSIMKQVVKQQQNSHNSHNGKKERGTQIHNTKRKRPQLPPIEQLLPIVMENDKSNTHTLFHDSDDDCEDDNTTRCAAKNNRILYNYHYEKTPWFIGHPHQKEEEQKQSQTQHSSSSTNNITTTTTTNNKNHLTKYYQSIPHQLQQKFNNELLSFYNYVKLTKDEINARQYMIECITNETNILFENGKKFVTMSGSGKGACLKLRDCDEIKRMSFGASSNCGGGVKVQTFGSFATPQVSTFWSDVDLAIWGVLDGKNDDHNHNFLQEIAGWDDNNYDDNECSGNGDHEGEEEEEEGGGEGCDDDSSSDSSRGNDMIRMTTTSVQRTMELIKKNNVRISTCATSPKSSTNDILTKVARIERWKSALSSMDLTVTDDIVDKSQLNQTEEIDGFKRRNNHKSDDKKVVNITEVTNQKEKESSNNGKDTKDDKSSFAAMSNTNKETKSDDNVVAEFKSGGFLFLIDREGAKEFGAENDYDSGCDEKRPMSNGDNVVEESKAMNAESDNLDKDKVSNRQMLVEKVIQQGEERRKSKEKENSSTSSKVIIELEDTDEDDEDKAMNFREVIEIGESSDSDDSIEISDDDSIDIMDKFHCRLQGADSDDESVDGVDMDEELQKYVAKFESSDGLEININANKIDHGAVARNGNTSTVGPKGNNRKMVVKALRLLSKRIRDSVFARNIEIRTMARVPIICINSVLGFDGDVALGGHNGMDTSHYVRKQVGNYERYVILLYGDAKLETQFLCILKICLD